MKTRIRQLLAILLAVFFLATLVSACQTTATTSSTASTTKATSGTTATTTTQSTTTEIKPVTLRAVLQAGPEVDLLKNPVLDRVKDATGITLDIEAPPSSDYWNRTRVIVASGDYPDLMAQGTDVDMEAWADEGILADITDLRKEYPNLMKNITELQWDDARALSTGKIHAVPRPNAYDRWGYMINQEWLDNLGLQAPTTVAEFLDVVRAFTHNDPDKNGKDDTYGVSFGANSDNKFFGLRHDFLSTPYGFSGHPGMPASDGAFYTNPTNPQYKTYLDIFKLMWDEDIIDREFITLKSGAQTERLAQDRVGIVGMTDKGYITGLFEQYSVPEEDLYKYTYHPPLKLSATDEPYYMMPPSNWMAFHVFADSKKIADTLRFLDYANSAEGFVLFQLGIEGVHYTSYDLEKRQLNRTDAQREALKSALGGGLLFANAYEGRPPVEGGNTPAKFEKWQKETLPAQKATTEIYVPFVKQLFTLGKDLPDEIRTVNSLALRYVTGEVAWEEVQNYISSVYAPKVAPYEKAYNDYMKENPPKFVKN